MPTPTFDNYQGPDGSQAIQLFAKTNWMIADLASPPYICSDGTVTTSPASYPLFDMRPFREVHAYIRSAGLTGGSTPTCSLDCYAYDSLTPHPGAGNHLHIMSTQAIAAAGGNGMLVLSENRVAITNTGVTYINNGTSFTSSYKPLFCQFRVNVTGTPSGLTGLRVHIYGVR